MKRCARHHRHASDYRLTPPPKLPDESVQLVNSRKGTPPNARTEPHHGFVLCECDPCFQVFPSILDSWDYDLFALVLVTTSFTVNELTFEAPSRSFLWLATGFASNTASPTAPQLEEDQIPPHLIKQISQSEQTSFRLQTSHALQLRPALYPLPTLSSPDSDPNAVAK